MAERKLTDKQTRFVEEYVKSLNATQSAIRAGYSEKTASEVGYQLLQKTSVSTAIEEAISKRAKKAGADADKTLLELSRVAYSDVRNLFDDEGRPIPVHLLDDDTAAAISSVEYDVAFDKEDNPEVFVKKVRLWPKVPANELIGKYYKLWTEKHEHSGGENPIEINHGLSDDGVDLIKRRILGVDN